MNTSFTSTSSPENNANANINSSKSDTFTDTAAYSSFTPSAPTAKEFRRAVQAFDEARPSFVGEHAMVCGTGLALILLARIGRTFELRMLVAAAGIALLARSASGRDGYVQKAKDALL